MPDPTTKRCSRCGETKALDAYYRQSYGLYGRQSMCKPCRRSRLEERRAEDPVLAAERRQWAYDRLLAWRASNPDRIREINERFRVLHRSERSAATRAYARAHREAVRENNDRYRARKKTALVQRVSRRAIYERDGGKCGICRQPVAFGAMHLDHIIPLVRGGTHEPKNVQVAHRRCNNRKYSTGPGQLRLLE